MIFIECHQIDRAACSLHKYFTHIAPERCRCRENVSHINQRPAWRQQMAVACDVGASLRLHTRHAPHTETTSTAMIGQRNVYEAGQLGKRARALKSKSRCGSSYLLAPCARLRPHSATTSSTLDSVVASSLALCLCFAPSCFLFVQQMINMTTIIVQVTCLGVAVNCEGLECGDQERRQKREVTLQPWGGGAASPPTARAQRLHLPHLAERPGRFACDVTKTKTSVSFALTQIHTRLHCADIGWHVPSHACMHVVPLDTDHAPSLPPTATAQHARSPSHCVTCMSCMSGGQACMHVLDHCDQLHLDDSLCVVTVLLAVSKLVRSQLTHTVSTLIYTCTPRSDHGLPHG